MFDKEERAKCIVSNKCPYECPTCPVRPAVVKRYFRVCTGY